MGANYFLLNHRKKILILIIFIMLISFPVESKIIKIANREGSEIQIISPMELITYMNPGRIYEKVVPGNQRWIDSGFNVFKGQVVTFIANEYDEISLQNGNQIARCGPEGYKMKSSVQPIKEENYGALIARIVKLISIEKDKETGKDIRNEDISYFHIGAENTLTIPQEGRLYFGINEIVVDDNDGYFKVTFYLDRKVSRNRIS